MVIKKQFSRLEINKMVRTELQKNSVDLTQIKFSSSIRSVRFTGRLLKGTGREFEVKEVENLVNAIFRLPCVREALFDVENWNISQGSISYKGKKDKKDAKYNEAEKRKKKLLQKKEQDSN